MDLKLKNKEIILSFYSALNNGGPNTYASIFAQYFNEHIVHKVTRPFDTMKGAEHFHKQFWEPLLYAFPDLEVQPYILMGGKSEDNDCVCVAGNLIGTFTENWLTIPANHQPVYIRFHAAYFMKDGLIEKAWYFLDILDVIRQAGFNLFPFKGLQQPAPAPMTGDGVITYAVNSEDSKASFALTNAMIDGLLEYDGKSIDSMAQERFWEVKNMMWYGPGGIGTTRGLKGFQKNHQIPFLKAFPDRGVIDESQCTDFINIGEGNYSCHFGYPIMYGKHLGDGWLGIEATSKTFTMRIMDFWRREGDKLRENWVMIDMIDVLEQFDIDVFKLLKNKINQS